MRNLGAAEVGTPDYNEGRARVQTPEGVPIEEGDETIIRHRPSSAGLVGSMSRRALALAATIQVIGTAA